MSTTAIYRDKRPTRTIHVPAAQVIDSLQQRARLLEAQLAESEQRNADLQLRLDQMLQTIRWRATH